MNPEVRDPPRCPSVWILAPRRPLSLDPGSWVLAWILEIWLESGRGYFLHGFLVCNPSQSEFSPYGFPPRLRLYSRVVGCEIRKIEVFYVDFSRPSPESKSGGGIH